MRVPDALFLRPTRGGALFLHIGLHKTGTTSLQSLLIRNADTLADEGIWYPQLGRHNGPSHENLKLELESGARFDPALGTWRDVVGAVNDYSRAIVSSENLSLLPIQAIASLAGLLQGIDTRIVVYLKRQDLLIQSWYSQRCKDRRTSVEFSEYLDAHGNDIQYRIFELLQPWAESFGDDSIVVRTIEHDQLVGGSLFSDFWAAIGARPELLQELIPVPSLNRSLSPRGLAIVRSIHQMRLDDGSFNQKDFARWVGGIMAQADTVTNPPPERGPLMSGRVAAEFLSQFAE